MHSSAELLGCKRLLSIKTEFSGWCVFVSDLHQTLGFVALPLAASRVLAMQAGVDAGQSAHAALVAWMEPGGTQLQLIIAGHLDEGTPPEGPLEARTKSGGLEYMNSLLKLSKFFLFHLFLFFSEDMFVLN